MRTLRFRAWDKEDSRMICLGWGWTNDDECIPVDGDWHDVVNHNDLEWMQFTGLTDKNGKEIYEGDIVDNVVFNGGGSYDLPQEVYFDGGCFCVGMGYVVDVKSMEVIGNIYENPELLSKLNN